MRLSLAVLAVSAVAACHSVPASAIDAAEVSTTDQSAIFEQFKSLDGLYDDVTEPGEDSWTVQYQTLSRGHSVMETWRSPPGPRQKTEMTIFHLDNGALRATHYCASGIQSHMALSDDMTDGRYVFSAVSTTNQPTPDTAFNSGFAYKFDGETILRDEYWTTTGEVSPSNVVLKRRN